LISKSCAHKEIAEFKSGVIRKVKKAAHHMLPDCHQEKIPQFDTTQWLTGPYKRRKLHIVIYRETEISVSPTSSKFA
jgi:hypothetical protein